METQTTGQQARVAHSANPFAEQIKNIQQSVTTASQNQLDRERRDAEARKKRDVHDAMLKAGVGERFANVSLDSYRPRSDTQAAALDACREYATEYRWRHGDGLVLVGDPGGGKTHLLCGIMREAAATGTSVDYLTVPDMFLRLQDRFGGNGLSEHRQLEEWVKPRLLVLDDLHSIKTAADGWQYQRLWILLDRRYRERRATLVSTNRPVTELQDMLDTRTLRRLAAVTIPVDALSRKARA